MITDCIFTSNVGDAGGAIFNNSGATISVIDSTFTSNTALLFGDGIYSGGTLDVTGCTFDNHLQRNAVRLSGGPATFTNCLFRDNAGTDGAAIFAAATLTLTNCTFSDNVATFLGGAVRWLGGGGRTLDVTNCVLWGNVDAIFPPNQLSVTTETGVSVTNTCIEDLTELDGNIPFNGPSDDHDNIDENPDFVDDTNNNFRLQASSPALETGDDAAVTEAFDLDGNPRKIGTVDMGAYERCATGTDCDDSDGCTTDICTAGLCSHNFCSGETPSCINDACVCLSNTDCDDGNDCTDDVCNGSGSCDHTNEPAQTACEDGLFCTSTGECDGFGTCVGGSGNPCKGNEVCCECGIEDGYCIPIGFQCSCPSG